MDHNGAHAAGRKEYGLLEQRHQEAAVLIGQCTGSTVHLNKRNDAQKKVDHPNGTVALEKIF